MTDQIWQGNTWGRVIFLGVSHTHHKGLGPSIPQFGASLLLMHTPFDAEWPNLVW